MEETYTGQSMVGPLHTVLVRRPDAAFAVADPQRWHYTARPDLAEAQREHDALVGILQREGAEVVYHDADLPHHADAVFVHDPVIVCDRGAILLRMGKELRRGEEAAMEQTLRRLGMTIHYRLHGEARAEGGDLMWLDEQTLAVGLGFRTNEAGLHQLAEALSGLGVTIVPVPLPYYEGPDACLHLMSFISMVDVDLAVVYRPLLPVPFFQLLVARGIELVDVPQAEFATMGPNVLALAPRRCLMLEDNPVTKTRLEAAGCTVYTYRGREISLKAEGGATCLTRPLYRETRRNSVSRKKPSF